MTMKFLNEYEKMLAGEFYFHPNAESLAVEIPAADLLKQFNETPMNDMSQRITILQQALVNYQQGMILSPIYWQYGNIEIGGNTFINFDCMFIDNAKITIGERNAIGMKCQFITVLHDFDHTHRVHFSPDGKHAVGGIGKAKSITIGDDCWLAASVIVLPGVTIGSRSVIGAGSVVTKSIPPDVFAAGNPCRVIKSIKK